MARKKDNGHDETETQDVEETIASAPNGNDIERFRGLMADVREQRSEANANAAEAREIFKGLGFCPEAIAMYKRLSDMGDNRGAAVLSELLLLVDADPRLSSGRQPDMFADAAVKEQAAAH